MSRANLRWNLECGDNLVCGCNHYIGEAVWCPKRHKRTKIVSWNRIDPNQPSYIDLEMPNWTEKPENESTE